MMIVTRCRARLVNGWRRVHGVRVRLTDDWRRAHHFACVRVAGALGALLLVAPVLADHWLEAAPFIMKFFPNVDQSVIPFIGTILFILARVAKFYRKDDAQ